MDTTRPDPTELVFQAALYNDPEYLHCNNSPEFLDDLFIGFKITRDNLILVREMLLYEEYDYGQHYYKRETEQRQLELLQYFDDPNLHETIFAFPKLLTNDKLAEVVFADEKRYYGNFFASDDYWGEAFLDHCHPDDKKAYGSFVSYAIRKQLGQMTSLSWLEIVLQGLCKRTGAEETKAILSKVEEVITDRSLLYGFLDIKTSAFRPSEHRDVFSENVKFPSEEDLFVRCMEIFADGTSEHHLRNWCVDAFGSFDGPHGADKFRQLKGLQNVNPTVLETWGAITTKASTLQNYSTSQIFTADSVVQTLKEISVPLAIVLGMLVATMLRKIFQPLQG